MTNEVHETSDGIVIAAVLAGDRDQFAELVRRYESALLRVARSRLGRAEWAEDAVQETLLCAFRFLSSYDSRYSFRTWLWTILLNQCRRHLKKRTRSMLVQTWSDDATASGIHERDIANQLRSEELPSDRLLADERNQLLDTLLGKLPESQADALRLRFFGGLKFREIAAAMDCSLSTAKNRVRWGLTKMAEFLEPENASSGTSTAESCNE